MIATSQNGKQKVSIVVKDETREAREGEKRKRRGKDGDFAP